VLLKVWGQSLRRGSRFVNQRGHHVWRGSKGDLGHYPTPLEEVSCTAECRDRKKMTQEGKKKGGSTTGQLRDKGEGVIGISMVKYEKERDRESEPVKPEN